VRACLHKCTHTYHSCIHTYTYTYIHACIHSCMRACVHAYVHTYIHIYIHIYTFISVFLAITSNVTFPLLFPPPRQIFLSILKEQAYHHHELCRVRLNCLFLNFVGVVFLSSLSSFIHLFFIPDAINSSDYIAWNLMMTME
jgi:hypothetical protein